MNRSGSRSALESVCGKAGEPIRGVCHRLVLHNRAASLCPVILLHTHTHARTHAERSSAVSFKEIGWQLPVPRTEPLLMQPELLLRRGTPHRCMCARHSKKDWFLWGLSIVGQNICLPKAQRKVWMGTTGMSLTSQVQVGTSRAPLMTCCQTAA